MQYVFFNENKSLEKNTQTLKSAVHVQTQNAVFGQSSC